MLKHLLVVSIVAATGQALAQSTGTPPPPTLAAVRGELEKAYKENADAFLRFDVTGVMALRSPDFHAVTPDGTRQDRAAMELYITGLMNGIREWKSQTFTIDSLDVRGDTAIATMSQHLVRMALRPDNLVHHVETWATQRETWVRSGSRWLLWRVDQVRNQRRLVGGEPTRAPQAVRS